MTRFVILRLLGLVYFAAFMSVVFQVLPLIGSQGLLPAPDFMARVEAHAGSRFDGFLLLPSLFWAGFSDRGLLVLAWVGAALSLVVMLGYANVLIMAALWVLYTSFVNIGQDWYGYGWEIQLLEIGFLAMFLCPLIDARPFPKRPAPVLIIWLFRWLSFRIMLGAGLIKLRGDECWRDLTCLIFHYETQPIPNPLTRWFHFMPAWFHKLGVLWNHLVELIVPWFAFGPRRARHIAGVLLVSFQGFLILSGNLSFLNYLTIVPMLACFDDSLLSKVLPKALVARAQQAAENNVPTPLQEGLSLAYAGVVAFLSIAPTMNLFSGGQVMNGSFDRLHLVNTYGAFGSVGRERDEIIFEGTSDEVVTPESVWLPYEFPFKPGDPMRRSRVIAPFQPRLDWAIWFAAMSSPNQYPWTLHFTWKLLNNDP
ncbi:MAG TPA: lipase maturation factor family protein, partial [Chthoniobacteraceae bacterium]